MVVCIQFSKLCASSLFLLPHGRGKALDASEFFFLFCLKWCLPLPFDSGVYREVFGHL